MQHRHPTLAAIGSVDRRSGSVASDNVERRLEGSTIARSSAGIFTRLPVSTNLGVSPAASSRLTSIAGSTGRLGNRQDGVSRAAGTNDVRLRLAHPDNAPDAAAAGVGTGVQGRGATQATGAGPNDDEADMELMNWAGFRGPIHRSLLCACLLFGATIFFLALFGLLIYVSGKYQLRSIVEQTTRHVSVNYFKESILPTALVHLHRSTLEVLPAKWLPRLSCSLENSSELTHTLTNLTLASPLEFTNSLHNPIPGGMSSDDAVAWDSSGTWLSNAFEEEWPWFSTLSGEKTQSSPLSDPLLLEALGSCRVPQTIERNHRPRYHLGSSESPVAWLRFFYRLPSDVGVAAFEAALRGAALLYEKASGGVSPQHMSRGRILRLSVDHRLKMAHEKSLQPRTRELVLDLAGGLEMFLPSLATASPDFDYWAQRISVPDARQPFQNVWANDSVARLWMDQEHRKEARTEEGVMNNQNTDTYKASKPGISPSDSQVTTLPEIGLDLSDYVSLIRLFDLPWPLDAAWGKLKTLFISTPIAEIDEFEAKRQQLQRASGLSVMQTLMQQSARSLMESNGVAKALEVPVLHNKLASLYWHMPSERILRTLSGFNLEADSWRLHKPASTAVLGQGELDIQAFGKHLGFKLGYTILGRVVVEPQVRSVTQFLCDLWHSREPTLLLRYVVLAVPDPLPVPGPIGWAVLCWIVGLSAIFGSVVRSLRNVIFVGSIILAAWPLVFTIPQRKQDMRRFYHHLIALVQDFRQFLLSFSDVAYRMALQLFGRIVLPIALGGFIMRLGGRSGWLDIPSLVSAYHVDQNALVCTLAAHTIGTMYCFVFSAVSLRILDVMQVAHAESVILYNKVTLAYSMYTFAILSTLTDCSALMLPSEKTMIQERERDASAQRRMDRERREAVTGQESAARASNDTDPEIAHPAGANSIRRNSSIEVTHGEDVGNERNGSQPVDARGGEDNATEEPELLDSINRLVQAYFSTVNWAELLEGLTLFLLIEVAFAGVSVWLTGIITKLLFPPVLPLRPFPAATSIRGLHTPWINILLVTAMDTLAYFQGDSYLKVAPAWLLAKWLAIASVVIVYIRGVVMLDNPPRMRSLTTVAVHIFRLVGFNSVLRESMQSPIVNRENILHARHKEEERIRSLFAEAVENDDSEDEEGNYGAQSAFIRRAKFGSQVLPGWKLREISIVANKEMQRLYIAGDRVIAIECNNHGRVEQLKMAGVFEKTEFVMAGVFVTSVVTDEAEDVEDDTADSDVMFQVFMPPSDIPNYELSNVRFAASKVFVFSDRAYLNVDPVPGSGPCAPPDATTSTETNPRDERCPGFLSVSPSTSSSGATIALRPEKEELSSQREPQQQCEARAPIREGATVLGRSCRRHGRVYRITRPCAASVVPRQPLVPDTRRMEERLRLLRLSQAAGVEQALRNLEDSRVREAYLSFSRSRSLLAHREVQGRPQADTSPLDSIRSQEHGGGNGTLSGFAAVREEASLQAAEEQEYLEPTVSPSSLSPATPRDTVSAPAESASESEQELMQQEEPPEAKPSAGSGGSDDGAAADVRQLEATQRTGGNAAGRSSEMTGPANIEGLHRLEEVTTVWMQRTNETIGGAIDEPFPEESEQGESTARRAKEEVAMNPDPAVNGQPSTVHKGSPGPTLRIPSVGLRTPRHTAEIESEFQRSPQEKRSMNPENEEMDQAGTTTTTAPSRSLQYFSETQPEESPVTIVRNEQAQLNIEVEPRNKAYSRSKKHEAEEVNDLSSGLSSAGDAIRVAGTLETQRESATSGEGPRVSARNSASARSWRHSFSLCARRRGNAVGATAVPAAPPNSRTAPTTDRPSIELPYRARGFFMTPNPDPAEAGPYSFRYVVATAPRYVEEYALTSWLWIQLADGTSSSPVLIVVAMQFCLAVATAFMLLTPSMLGRQLTALAMSLFHLPPYDHEESPPLLSMFTNLRWWERVSCPQVQTYRDLGIQRTNKREIFYTTLTRIPYELIDVPIPTAKIPDLAFFAIGMLVFGLAAWIMGFARRTYRCRTEIREWLGWVFHVPLLQLVARITRLIVFGIGLSIILILVPITNGAWSDAAIFQPDLSRQRFTFWNCIKWYLMGFLPFALWSLTLYSTRFSVWIRPLIVIGQSNVSVEHLQEVGFTLLLPPWQAMRSVMSASRKAVVLFHGIILPICLDYLGLLFAPLLFYGATSRLLVELPALNRWLLRVCPLAHTLLRHTCLLSGLCRMCWLWWSSHYSEAKSIYRQVWSERYVLRRVIRNVDNLP